MKKIIIAIAAVAMTTTVFAQEKAKKQFPHEAGDMALVIDATPFLNYAGDLLNFGNGPAATAPTFESFQATVMGKYFLDDKHAVRVRFGINKDNTKYRNNVQDDAHVATDFNAQVTDFQHNNAGYWELGLGYEWRIGKQPANRIQAYAAAEVFFGNGKGRTHYSYGNEITSVNQNPTTTNDFFNNTSAPMGNARLIDEKMSSVISYGAAGVIGIDFFIMPQLSVGGEIRIEARAANFGKTYQQVEYWDAASQTSRIAETEGPKESYFGINGLGMEPDNAGTKHDSPYYNFLVTPVLGLNLTFHF